MIPRANITAWRTRAPWPSNDQVEQDLVLSRALVAIFQSPTVAEGAVFRGGTALHKLFLETPGRYSEDIDLVQREPGPIGELVGAVRAALDPWLGSPRWKQTAGRFTLTYRFETTFVPASRMRLKVEVNTREHFSVLGVGRLTFVVENPWFRGSVEVPVYRLEELLGTTLRALYQRKKGRDLYDLWRALGSRDADPDLVVECFSRYMEHGGASVSRAELESNLAGKLGDRAFLEDTRFLIPADAGFDPTNAARLVRETLIARLPGRPWKGDGSAD